MKNSPSPLEQHYMHVPFMIDLRSLYKKGEKLANNHLDSGNMCASKLKLHIYVVLLFLLYLSRNCTDPALSVAGSLPTEKMSEALGM